MESILSLIILIVFIMAVAFAYKKRVAIAKWLDDPAMVVSLESETRKRYLKRRIEDAEAEIKAIDDVENKKENEVKK